MKIKTIVKTIIITPFILYVAYGLHRCSEEGAKIKLEFKESNPTVYDFPFSADSVENAIMAIADDYIDYSYDKKYTGNDSITLWVQNEQRSYIYLYKKKEDRIYAQEYSSPNGVLEYYVLLARIVHLNKDSTRVIVEKSENCLHCGVVFWTDFNFESYIFKEHIVNTPPIREYDFLRLIGKKLSYLKNMPFTKYPKELSQKRIISLWGGHLPFYVEEIFEYPEEGLNEWCIKEQIYSYKIYDYGYNK